jgi:CRP/FNR family cyclic AMP-dependent transcriptional regulator
MKTILLIEDNAEIRENMGEILSLASYRVLEAANGLAGVAMALTEVPDLIVCDIMMPELDGYGVIHLLHKNPTTETIPFIFLTAKAERAEMRKGMELGADDYITKPFSSTELLNAVEGRLKKATTVQSAKRTNLPDPVVEENNTSLADTFTQQGETHTYTAKQRIYSEGQEASKLYRAGDTTVRIYRTNEEGKEFVTAVCGTGEYFGFSALLEGTPHRECAEALETGDISSITKDEFEAVMKNNPEAKQGVMKMLAGDVHEKGAQLLSMAYNSLRKKVAEALVMLHKKTLAKAVGIPVSIQISRESLAAIAGTAKESLIRTLGEFRDEGLISINGRAITILEEKKLVG